MSKKVRTRFAPSPTGMMHLGGARTALFNYLFAKHFNGEFLVRFEDTDLSRNVHSSIEKLLFDLKWMDIKVDATIGMQDDYGPYCQSQRLNIYHSFANKLLTQKKIYPCFCSPLDLKKERDDQIKNGQKAPQYSRKCLSLSSVQINQFKKNKQSFCLRFYVQPGAKVSFSDLVYGQVTTAREHIEDFVIIKTDDYPTYNFAVVIDDHLMDITHVWRGSDHLSNTAKQILLYEAFNWNSPFFGHLSLIQFSDQKMSKRFDIAHQNIDYYRHKGYLAKAMVNYLVLLGWTPDKFQELFTHDELIQRFDGQHLNKNQSIFSFQKLNWINNKKIVELSQTQFENYCDIFVALKKKELTENINQPNKLKKYEDNQLKINLLNNLRLQDMLFFFQKEINNFDHLFELLFKFFLPSNIFFNENKDYLYQNHFLFSIFQKYLTAVIWKSTNIGQMLQQMQKDTALTGRSFFAPLYCLMINQPHGPPMIDFMFLFGKTELETQLQKYFEFYAQNKFK